MTFPPFLMFPVFCSGKVSLILKGHLTFVCWCLLISQGRTRLVLGQRLAISFVLTIFSTLLIAILSILFILLTLLTLVFKSKAKRGISDSSRSWFNFSKSGLKLSNAFMRQGMFIVVVTGTVANTGTYISPKTFNMLME